MREKLKELNEPIHNSKESAVLSKLFRVVLKELNLLNKVEYYIDRYIRNANKNDLAVQKRKTRSSLSKNIVADEMTWKTFSDLIFNLLRVKKCRITIELFHINNTKSVHSVNMVKDVDDTFKEEKEKEDEQ